MYSSAELHPSSVISFIVAPKKKKKRIVWLDCILSVSVQLEIWLRSHVTHLCRTCSDSEAFRKSMSSNVTSAKAGVGH